MTQFDKLNRTLTSPELQQGEIFGHIAVEKATAQCMEYSEQPETLKKLLGEITIKTQFKGIDRFFDGDKEERPIVRVFVERGKKEIDFRFGMSIADKEVIAEAMRNIPVVYQRQNGKLVSSVLRVKKAHDVIKGLLYSVLCCMSSEASCPDSFEDFCGDFGYDTDSRKALDMHEKLREMSKKIHSILSEEEIESLPR